MSDFIISIAPWVEASYFMMLGLFLFASIMLTSWTWFVKQRLRNCIMTWSDPGFGGIPVFPAVFTILTVSVAGMHFWVGITEYRVYEIIYMLVGVNWLFSYQMMAKRYITDHGIVKNINDPSQTIAWNRINDYLELPKQGYTEFTFFFTVEVSDTLQSQRLRLKVPDSLYESFRKIVTYKVDRHLSQSFSEFSDLERSSME